MQDDISFTHRNIANVLIVSKLDTYLRALSTDFTRVDSLFGAVKSTKNTDPNKYGYSGYGKIDEMSKFRLSNGKWGMNVVISSMHADNIKNIYWFLVKVQQMGEICYNNSRG